MKSLNDIRKGGNYKQFIPSNPIKYVGKYPIYVLSSWELSMCKWLDNNPKILIWSSESIVIKYFNPVKNKISRYYPDFYIKTSNNEDFIIEVKPFKETMIPNNGKGGKSKKTMIYEHKTYITNQAKWTAAKKWCDKMGMKFKIITEKSLLFGK